ncbi:hypothetical protein GJAV_G00135260 [Gymnothorax javanicus]|nr:hypothetical protein GJAV_G00135260 [Gymnothorax javanicus]
MVTRADKHIWECIITNAKVMSETTSQLPELNAATVTQWFFQVQQALQVAGTADSAAGNPSSGCIPWPGLRSFLRPFRKDQLSLLAAWLSLTSSSCRQTLLGRQSSRGDGNLRPSPRLRRIKHFLPSHRHHLSLSASFSHLCSFLQCLHPRK